MQELDAGTSRPAVPAYIPAESGAAGALEGGSDLMANDEEQGGSAEKGREPNISRWMDSHRLVLDWHEREELARSPNQLLEEIGDRILELYYGNFQLSAQSRRSLDLCFFALDATVKLLGKSPDSATAKCVDEALKRLRPGDITFRRKMVVDSLFRYAEQDLRYPDMSQWGLDIWLQSPLRAARGVHGDANEEIPDEERKLCLAAAGACKRYIREGASPWEPINSFLKVYGLGMENGVTLKKTCGGVPARWKKSEETVNDR